MQENEWAQFVQEQITELSHLRGFNPSPRYRQEFTDEIMDMLGDSDHDKSGRGMTREDRLSWLVSIFLRDIGEWPVRGITEFRAIYGSFFGCADGKGSPSSTLPGWTPADLMSDRRSRLALPRIEEQKPKYETTPITPEEQAEWEASIQQLAEKFKQKRGGYANPA